jgi:preprotein translocase subunit YajC
MMAMNTSGGGEMVNMLLLLGGLGLIMYFTVFRPQANERKAHDAMVTGLTKGDRIVLNSGFHGKIVEVKELTVVVELAPKTSVTIEKTAIARLDVQKDVQAASK